MLVFYDNYVCPSCDFCAWTLLVGLEWACSLIECSLIEASSLKPFGMAVNLSGWAITKVPCLQPDAYFERGMRSFQPVL